LRFLNSNIIIFEVVILVLLIFIPFINIMFITKKAQNALLLFITIISAFCEAFLFCTFMRIGIIQLEIENRYIVFQKVFLILSALSFLIAIVFFIFQKNANLNIKLSPDLNGVFSKFDDAIFVINSFGQIDSKNPATSLISSTSDTIFELIDNIVPLTDNKSQSVLSSSLVNYKSSSKNDILLNNIYYQITVSPIISNKNYFLGSYIIFHNIHKKKILLQEIDEQNYKLIFANKELIEKIKLANALEEERERLKIVNQIQVSLLDRIEGAKADIVAFNNSSQELVIKDYHSFFSEINVTLRGIFSQVRNAVQSLSKKHVDTTK